MSKFVLTAELQLQAPNNVRQVVSQIQSQLKGVSLNVNVQQAGTATKQLNNVSKSANRASGSFNKLNGSLKANINRFTGLAIATRAVSLFTNTLGNAVREAIDFERELVKVAQVTGKSMESLKGLSNTITQLSTSLGVSSTSLLSVSRILAQTGLSARDTQTALATLARTELAPTFENITQTAEGAVAILNQFGQGAAALEEQLGSLNAVAGQFAVESGDLIAVIRRTGGVFKAAGGDLNELIALFTSVRATTRESAESISTGLRTIFTRIQRPKTIEFLKQYGVELLDLEGKFVGPFEAVRRLSQALKGLEQGDITFIEIAEQLGGFRQIGKVIPLLQQFSTAQAALNVAQAGSGSLATDAAKAQLALGIQITKVKEEFLALVRSVTASTTFQIMADTVLKLASALIKLADALAPIIPLLTAFAGIKLLGSMGKGVGGMLGGFNKGGKVTKLARGGQVPVTGDSDIVPAMLGAFSKGGKVMKFARGGSVPGTGNRDTVPAMLMPGEFVIKKDSVAKLGAGNLEAMNKYAAGGIVARGRHTYGKTAKKARKKQTVQEKLGDEGVGARFQIDGTDIAATLKAAGDKNVGDSDLDIGGAFLQPQGVVKNLMATLQAGDTAKLMEPIKKGLGTVTPAETAEIGKLSKQLKIDVQSGSLNAQVAEGFQAQLKSSIATFASEFATKSFGGKPKFNISKFNTGYGQANPAQIEGNIFEAFITGLSDQPFNEQRDAANATFDYPLGLGSAGPIFGMDGTRIADAKRTFNEDALGSLAKKGVNKLVEGFRSNVASKLIAEAKGSDFDEDSTTGKARKKAASKPSLSRTPARRAMGSTGPEGPDTVPALLTPGEFVINKKSAQNIGYGKLGRMNKIAKFNKGGPVGSIVQRFEDGGGVGGFDTAGINALGESSMVAAQSMTSFVTAMLNTAATQNQITQANVTQLAALGQITQAEATAATTTLQNNDAKLKALDATNKETKASLEAAEADKKEAAESNKASQDLSDSSGKTKMSMEGMMMSIFALQAAFAMFLPTIDESSGTMDYFLNSLNTLTMQLVTLGMVINTDFVKNMAAAGLSALQVAGSFATKLLPSIFGASTSMKAQAVASAAATTADVAETAGSAAATGADVAEAGGSLFATIADMAEGVASYFAAGPIGLIAGAIIGLIAVITAGISIFYLWNKAAAEAAEAESKRKAEKGDIAGAEGAAGRQADAEANTAAVGFGVVAAIGIVAMGPFASAAIIAAESTVSLSKTQELLKNKLVTAAGASAALSAATKALADGQKEATQAMKEFRDGSISAADALARTRTSSEAVALSAEKVRQANLAAQASVYNFYTALGDIISGFTFGFTSLGFGTTEDAQKKVTEENEARDVEQKKKESELMSQNQPAINALGKQVAATGGDFNTFMAQLQAANPELAKLANQDDLQKAFDNIAKEAERTRAAFDAMNLGFQGINAAASAANLGMSNLVDGFDGSISRMDQTINTLKAGVTNAAQGMSSDVFEQAVNHASSQIERLGGDATKFRENIKAINTAQKFFVNASKSAKDALVADFKRGAGGAGNSGDRRGAFADAVVGQMDGVGDDVKKRILDALKGADISNEDLDEIMAGNFAVLDKVLADLGDTTLDQVLPALEALAEASEKLAQVQTKRLALEDELASAVKRQIDVTLEAAEIMAEFGGPQVTPQQQSQAIVDKLNVTGADVGLSQMTSGSADEIRNRNREIAKQQEKQRETRNEAAAGNQEAQAEINSPQFKADEERLQKAAEENYQLTKALIDVKRDEIKVINAKNAAEKKAAEQLLGNDIEGFLDTMAGKGAAAAAAIGDPTLANQFGMSAFGTANKQLEEMQNAGVTSFMGQDIGQVRQNAVGMGLSSAGLAPGVAQGMAEAATGTSPEAEAAKAAARDLASTLPQSTGNLKTATANMLEAAKIQEREANKKVQEAVDEVESNKPPVTTTPPPTEKFDPTTRAPIINPFTDPVGAAMQEQGLDPTVSSPAAGATPPPDQQAESKPSQVQSEFERIQKQVEGDVQKVFVVNLNEMSSLASSEPMDLTGLRQQAISLLDPSAGQEGVDSINSMGLEELKRIITSAGLSPDMSGASVENVAEGGGGIVDSLISGITAPLTAVSNVGSTIGQTVSTAITAPFSALQAAINPLTAIQGILNTSIQGLTGTLSGGVLDLTGPQEQATSPLANPTQVEGGVQKVFVINLNEMSSTASPLASPLASSGPSNINGLREQAASLTTSPEQVDIINSMGLDELKQLITKAGAMPDTGGASVATTELSRLREQAASLAVDPSSTNFDSMGLEELKQIITKAGAMPDTGGVSVAATEQVGVIDSLISGITAPLTAVSNLGSSVKDAVNAPFTALTGAIGPLTGAIGPLNTSIQNLSSALGGGLDLSGLIGFGENLAGFNDSFKAQVDRLEAMNINITFGSPVDVNVNINGGEALKSITAKAKQEIMAEVSTKLKNLYVGNEPVVRREGTIG
jgi:hypothetical protein